MSFKQKAGLALALAAIFTTGGANAAFALNVTDSAVVDDTVTLVATDVEDLKPGEALVVNNLKPEGGVAVLDVKMGTTFASTIPLNIAAGEEQVDVISLPTGSTINLTGDGSGKIFPGDTGTIVVLADGVAFNLGTTDPEWADLQQGGQIPDIKIGTEAATGGLDTAETVTIAIEAAHYDGGLLNTWKANSVADVLELDITDGGSLKLDSVDLTTTDRTTDTDVEIVVDSTGAYGVAGWEVTGDTILGINGTANFIEFIHDWASTADQGVRADHILAGGSFVGGFGMGANQAVTLGAKDSAFITAALNHLTVTGGYATDYKPFGEFSATGTYRGILGVYAPQDILAEGYYVVDAATSGAVLTGANTAQAAAGNVFFSDNSVFAVDAQMGRTTESGNGLPVFTVDITNTDTDITAGGSLYIGGNAADESLNDEDPAPATNPKAATFYAQNAVAGHDLVVMRNIKDNGITVGYGDISDEGSAAGVLNDGGIAMTNGTNDLDDANTALDIALDNTGHWNTKDGTLLFSSDFLTGEFNIVYGTGANDHSLVLKVSRNDVKVKDVYPHLSNGMAGMVDQVYGEDAGDVGHNNVNSDNAGIKFVSRATDNSFMPNHEEAAAVLESAAQIAVAAAVPAVTGNVMTKISALVVDHNNMLNSVQPAYGNEPGALGIWVNPFYGISEADGLDSGSFEGAYEMSYGGAAFGVDYNLNEALRVGLALNVGGGSSDSDDAGSDFSNTGNDFDFFGVSLYGSYSNGTFGLTGDLGYTGVDNEIDQDVPVAMGLGNLKSNVDSDAFTVGLTGQYRFAASENLSITPHLGLRYTKVSTDDADVKLASGGRVFNVTTDDQNLFQIPLGVEFSRAIVTDGGWTLTPSADLGVLFTMGDTDVESRASIPGFGFSGRTSTDVTDSAAFTGKLGVTAAADNGLSLGLDYGILASGNQTDHQFSGMLRYEF